jgi:hypothetical protein
MNLDAILERSISFDQDKTDVVVETTEFQFDEQGRINIPKSLFTESSQLPMTDNALQQACNKLGPPPYKYMSECPKDLMATNLNHWRKQLNKGWFVRVYDGNARAVLSTDYTPIMNTSVIEMVRDIIGNTPHRIARPHIDPDCVHLRILVADDKGGNHSIGAYVGNGETGNHQVKVLPLIQRMSCDNSILISGQGWSQKHIHVSPSYIMGSIKEHLGQALRFATDALDNIVSAEMQKIPNFADVVTSIAKDKGLLEYRDLIIMGAETDQTRMGLVNGLSFAARDSQVEDALVMENLAGHFLVNEWRR